jgi:hypothetical protein
MHGGIPAEHLVEPSSMSFGWTVRPVKQPHQERTTIAMPVRGDAAAWTAKTEAAFSLYATAGVVLGGQADVDSEHVIIVVVEKPVRPWKALRVLSRTFSDGLPSDRGLQLHRGVDTLDRSHAGSFGGLSICEGQKQVGPSRRRLRCRTPLGLRAMSGPLQSGRSPSLCGGLRDTKPTHSLLPIQRRSRPTITPPTPHSGHT